MSDIFTPGCAFLQGKKLIQKLTSIATYFNHPHLFQQLDNVQEYNNVPVGYPSCLCMTRVSIVHKLVTQSLLFYWLFQRFYDETKYTKE